MQRALALTYRPARFADVVGQAHVKPVLKAMVAADRLPPALIFAGSRGTGKTSTARILAAALNCAAPLEGDACGQCDSCKDVQDGRSLSVIEVDAASNGGVAEIRRIKDMALYAHPGLWRVILLDEAHSLSREACNALLQIMEFPPANTIFLLLTTEIDKILATVRSRAMTFDFRRLPESDLIVRLSTIATAEGIEADESLVAEIAARVDGGMRDAVMLLDQCARVGVKDAIDFAALFGLRNVAGSLIAAALSGDMDKGFEIIEEVFHRTGEATQMTSDLVGFVSDMLSVQSGGAPRRARGKADVAIRTLLSSKTSPERCVAAMKVLWDLKARLRAIESDQRSQMDMAFVLICEALKTKPYKNSAPIPSQMPIPPATSSPLSLQQIAGMQNLA